MQQKTINSRHSIASGGRHRVQKGSVVLVLECGHAVLGTQSEHGAAKRLSCLLCEHQEQDSAAKDIAALQSQIDALRARMGTKAARVQSLLPRQSRADLRVQALKLLSEKPCTALDIGDAVGVPANVVGKTLHQMAGQGRCVRVGRTDDGRIVWGLPSGQLVLGGAA